MSEAAVPGVRTPSLRGALWLYFLVLVGTTIAFTLPSQNAPRVFLSLVASLFVTAGFTVAAIFINRISFGPLLGERPTWRTLVLSFFAGLLIWVPALWVGSLLFSWLSVNFGARLSIAQTQFNLTLDQTVPYGITVFVLGIIVPITQGFLFWGYLRRAAEPRLGRRWTALIIALLFGLFGLYSSRDGMSGIPEALLVGLVTSAVVYFTDSAWSSIAVLIGYNLASPLLNSALSDFISVPDYNEAVLRSFMIAVITLFFAFVVIQFIRITAKPVTSSPTKISGGLRLWWLPVVLSIALSLFFIYGEIVVREGNPIGASGSILPGGTGSTIPPVVIATSTPRSAPQGTP